MPAFGLFELDPESHRLACNGHEIRLRPKAFALLALLIEAAPRVVSKREIHERLWPGGVVSDATLVALVKELRRVLNDHDRRAPVIRTVHRVGYALGTVARTGSAAPARGLHWLVAGDRERFPLTAGENVIGRDPQADVWLDYATVSRRHARISVAGEHLTIEDLGSKNGTRVAGQRVLEPTALCDGDRIAFGRVVVTYRRSAAGPATITEASRLTVARSRA